MFESTCRENKRTGQKYFHIPTSHLDKVSANKMYRLKVEEVAL